MADEDNWNHKYVLKPVVKLLKSRKHKITDAINLCKVSLSKTKKFEDIQQILCAGDFESKINYLSDMPSTPKKGGSNLDWGTILSDDGRPTNEMPSKEKDKPKISHQDIQKQSITSCTEKNVSKEESSVKKIPSHKKLPEPYYENDEKPKNQMPAKIAKTYQEGESIDRPLEASMPKNVIPKKRYTQIKQSASPPDELPPPCPEIPSNDIPLKEHNSRDAFGWKSSSRPMVQPFEKRKKPMDPDIPRPLSMQLLDPQKIKEAQRKRAESKKPTSASNNLKLNHGTYKVHRRESTTPPIAVHKYTPSRTYQKDHLIKEGEPTAQQADSKNIEDSSSVSATERQRSNHHDVGLEQTNSASNDVPTSMNKNHQQTTNKNKEASELKADKEPKKSVRQLPEIELKPVAVTTFGKNEVNPRLKVPDLGNVQVKKPVIVETKPHVRSNIKKLGKKGAKRKKQDQETEDGKPKELEFEYREEARLYIKPPKVPLSKELTDNTRIVEKDVVPANVPKNYRMIAVPTKPGEVQETYLMKLRTKMLKDAEKRALENNKSIAGQQQKETPKRSTSVRGCKLTTQEPPKTELSDAAIAKKKEELKAEALREASLVASKALQEVKKIFQNAENKFIPIAEEAISVDKTLKEGVINLIDTMSEEAIGHSSDQNIANEKKRSETVANLKKTNTFTAMNSNNTNERFSEKGMTNTALKKPPIATSTWDKKQNMNEISEPADIYTTQRSTSADHQVPTSIWGEISLEEDKAAETERHTKFADKRQTESLQVEVLKQGIYESSDKNNSNSTGQNPLDKNKMHQNIPVRLPSEQGTDQETAPAQNTEGKGHHGESNARSNPNYLARRYATDLVRSPGPVTLHPPPSAASLSGNPSKPPTRSPPSQTPPARGPPTSGQGSDDGSGKDPPEFKVLLPSNNANQSVQTTIKVEFQIVQDENSGQPKLTNEKILQRDSINEAGAKLRSPGIGNSYVNFVSKDISSRKNKTEKINKAQQNIHKQDANVFPAQQSTSSTHNQNEKFVTPNVKETVSPTQKIVDQKQVNENMKANRQDRSNAIADVNVYYYDAESMDADERRAEAIKLANEGKRQDNDKFVEQGRIAMASTLAEKTKKVEEIKLVDAKLKEEAIKLAEKLRTEAVKLAEEKLKEEAMKLAEERRMIEQMKIEVENRKVAAAKLAEENQRSEDLKLAEEKKKADTLKLAEERKQAEALKLAEERKKAEALKLAEERKKAEALKLAEELKKTEALKLAEERKKAEALKLAEEQKKAEALKLAEEQKKAEALKLAEEQKKAEALKLAEEQKKAEALKLAEERKKAEALKLAEERKKAEALKLAEERKMAEALKLAEERKKAEALKLAEERKKAEALKLAEERKKAEALKLAQERKKAEALKLAEERIKAEALKLAEERKRAEALKLAEERKKAEDIRQAAERQKAEAIKLAEERRKTEELKIALEKKKAEAIKLAAEKKKAEELRLAEEKKRLEAFRLAEERRKLDEIKAVEEKKRIEAIKLAEEKWKAEAFKLSEEKRKVEALRASEERWRAEALKLIEDKKRADAIRLAEEKRRAIEIKFEQEKLKVESLRLSEEKWKTEAIKLAAEKQMAIANKIAEEKSQVEAARLAKEEEKARAQKLAEDKRRAEAFRKAEETRKMEEKRIAEAFKRAEEKRKAEELEKAEQRKKEEAMRLAEEKSKAEEIKRLEEKKKAEAIRKAKAEEIRLADEKKRNDAAKLAEEKRKAEEIRLVAEKKASEAIKAEKERKRVEALRLAEEKRREEEIKIAEGGKKAAMQKIAQEKQKEEEVKLAEGIKKAEAIRLAENKWKAEVVKRAEDKRLLEQIRAAEEKKRADAEKLAAERQKAEELKIIEETKRMEAMKLAEAKKKEEIRKFNEGKGKVETVAYKPVVKKFEHVKEDEREVIKKLSVENKERVDQATSTDKEDGKMLETVKEKNKQFVDQTLKSQKAVDKVLSESDKKRKTEALKLTEVKRNAEAIKQAEQRSKAEAVKAAAEARLNEEKRKQEGIKAADLKKKQEYLVLIEKKRKAQAAKLAEEIKKDKALHSDSENKIATKTSPASTIWPAYEGKRNSHEAIKNITKKTNSITLKSITPNISGESAILKKTPPTNSNLSSNSKTIYRPMANEWEKNLPPSADAGPLEKGIGTFYDWTTPSSLARKAALHMELPIHRQGQRRLDGMKRDMSIKSANRMYQMSAPCKTNLSKPATPCPVCPDAPPPAGAPLPPGNTPPPPGNTPAPPGDLPPRPSSSAPPDPEPIRSGPAQLTGISKYFNSQTISGRANVAKATFALMGLFVLNRMMKKPSKESKPHAKR